MHDTPTDLRAVLRDYAEEMVLPALEIYTHGLMTDSTMYDAFLETRKKESRSLPTKEKAMTAKQPGPCSALTPHGRSAPSKSGV